VLALTAVLVALPLPPPADGAALRPPPQPPSSPAVLAAPEAVAAALRVVTLGSQAAEAAVDTPLPADGGGRSGLDVVRGTPAAAAVAAAAAGGTTAGIRPDTLAITAMVWSLLTADNASTAAAGVFSRARCLARVASAGPPLIAVGGGGGGGEGGNSPPITPFSPVLLLPAPLVARLPPAGTPAADPHLVSAALATLRTVAVFDAACAELMPPISAVAALRTPPRSVSITITPAVGESSAMTMTRSSVHTRSVRSHLCKQYNAHVNKTMKPSE